MMKVGLVMYFHSYVIPVLKSDSNATNVSIGFSI